MIQLRASQVRALQEDASRRFTAEMCQRVVEVFPKKTAHWDEAATRSVVDAGIREAEVHGIFDRNDISRYLDYFVEFDGEFGISSETRWARQILKSEASGTDKMDHIDDHALALLIEESKK